MAAAFSIVSLVIFFAACACAHNTPGKSVPARPIPEQVFTKFRRSSMLVLLFVESRRRARKIPHHGPHPLHTVDRFLVRGVVSDCPAAAFFARTLHTIVRFAHPERSFHDTVHAVFGFPVHLASEFLPAASANDDGRPSFRRREGSHP